MAKVRSHNRVAKRRIASRVKHQVRYQAQRKQERRHMARRFQQALLRDTVDTTTELVAEEADHA